MNIENAIIEASNDGLISYEASLNLLNMVKTDSSKEKTNDSNSDYERIPFQDMPGGEKVASGISAFLMDGYLPNDWKDCYVTIEPGNIMRMDGKFYVSFNTTRNKKYVTYDHNHAVHEASWILYMLSHHYTSVSSKYKYTGFYAHYENAGDNVICTCVFMVPKSAKAKLKRYQSSAQFSLMALKPEEETYTDGE